MIIINLYICIKLSTNVKQIALKFICLAPETLVISVTNEESMVENPEVV